MDARWLGRGNFLPPAIHISDSQAWPRPRATAERPGASPRPPATVWQLSGVRTLSVGPGSTCSASSFGGKAIAFGSKPRKAAKTRSLTPWSHLDHRAAVGSEIENQFPLTRAASINGRRGKSKFSSLTRHTLCAAKSTAINNPRAIWYGRLIKNCAYSNAHTKNHEPVCPASAFVPGRSVPSGEFPYRNRYSSLAQFACFDAGMVADDWSHGDGESGDRDCASGAVLCLGRPRHG